MAVKEQGSEVVFLRQVIPGGAEKSFGIHVARLAGLPSRVVGRAEEVLQGLEASRQGEEEYGGAGVERAIVRDERAVYEARVETWRSILQQLMAVDIANMTPLQALNLLNEMQARIKESSSRMSP
jgi:DNA mismatch repair protein MutS